MNDPRKLAEDILADCRELTDAREVTLARELLKALGERNNALIQARAWRDATERREAERDRLYRELGERERKWTNELVMAAESERNAAEAERDRLAEALQRADSFISDDGLSDRSAANSARMVIRAALANLDATSKPEP
jgi:hypothetical protein